MSRKILTLLLSLAFFGILFTGCDYIGITVKTGNIKVVNNTGFYLKSLEYKSSEGSEWKSASLGSSIFSLATDNSISLLQPGTYEVRAEAVGSDAGLYFVKNDITVKSNNETTTVNIEFGDMDLKNATKGVIKIDNNIGKTIYYVYMRTNGTTDWGTDQLGALTTLGSKSFYYAFIEPGNYDFKAMDSTDKTGADYYSNKTQYPSGIPVTKGVVSTWKVETTDVQ